MHKAFTNEVNFLDARLIPESKLVIKDSSSHVVSISSVTIFLALSVESTIQDVCKVWVYPKIKIVHYYFFHLVYMFQKQAFEGNGM